LRQGVFLIRKRKTQPKTIASCLNYDLYDYCDLYDWYKNQSSNKIVPRVPPVPLVPLKKSVEHDRRRNACDHEIPAILKSRRDHRIAGVPPALCRNANKKALEIKKSLISG
jgi:hypothetical protein